MLAQQCCMMLASFEQAFRLQQRDENTEESKDTVLESHDFPLRRSPAKYDCQAPNIWVPCEQPVSGSSP